MADKENKPNEEEMRIPVFNVLKKGNIIKNIILNNPPSSLESESLENSDEKGEKSGLEGEKILVGRHPDCHIVLDHPSISRFHLQIYSQPSLQKISLMDLSSVHGTWVSEQKIEPQVPVELKEGDTLRLGVSTRIYGLQWVPWSRVFEIENPIISPAPIPEEKEEAYQDENFMPSVKNQNDLWDMQIPSAPPMPELLSSPYPVEDFSADYDIPVDKENLKLKEESFFLTQSPLEREIQSPPKRRDALSVLAAPHTAESVSSSMPLGVLMASDAQLEMENCSLEAHFTTEVLSEEENRLPIRSGLQDMSILSKRENQSQQKRRPEQTDALSILGAPHTAESVSSSMPLGVLTVSYAQLEIENCSPEAHFTTEVLPEEENRRLDIRSGKQDTSSLWSRRGKSASFLRIHTGRGVSSDARMAAESQKENMYIEQDKKEEKICKVLFPGAADEEDESIPSDKENMTPKIPPSLKLKKGKPEIQQTELLKSSLKVIVPSSDVEEDSFPANKENTTPNRSYEMKSSKPTSENQRRIKLEMMLKRRAERVPFQSLLANSISNGKSVTVPNATTSKNSNSVNYSHIIKEREINTSSANQSVDQVVHKAEEVKRKWYMVVDTSCLLNEESRRSLKLLEGLKGTHLIIPRMVIRELDCLKRRGSWFRKVDEASSILQWIEECMVKTRWWIHVQSSAEGMAIAPTPPASPRLRLSGGSNEFGTVSSVPFSSCGSLMEIVSPTAEDHILECALLFKRNKIDGQLVLLTNDITLKIKAMAEGLICETAKEFRDSLVNPYSERFLWAESTLIGPIWSRTDEAGLKENYYYCPLIKKTAKAAEGAKGLKLILFHNSHYGQNDPVK